MRTCVATLLLGLGVGLVPSAASAVSLRLAPGAQVVPPGPGVQVAVVISGLGDLAPPSLGVFDVDVAFDPAVLGFVGAVYGDPILGDQLDLSGAGSDVATGIALGTVNLFELSSDPTAALHAGQAGEFTLVTVSFDALANGVTPLDLGVNALGDAFGNPLAATVAGASILVPEPALPLLVALGLTVLAAVRGVALLPAGRRG